MIAKRVRRRRAGSFGSLADYILRRERREEDIQWARATNCGFDDPALAVAAIEATQALNTRCKADKTVHLVVSFRPEDADRLNPGMLADIEEEMAQALGMGDHQRLSVVHRDTDNAHVHIAISRIHPETLRAVERRRDWLALDAVCAAMERRHGLARDNRIGQGRGQGRGGTPAAAAGDMGAHSGQQPFRDWLAEKRTEIAAAADAAQSWDALHAALAEFDLEIKPRGAGLVVASRSAPAARAKASDVGRTLSIGALTERLGDYAPPAPDAARPRDARPRYEAEPAVRAGPRPSLWRDYCAERDRSLAGKRQRIADARAQRGTEMDRARRRWNGRRAEVYGDGALTRAEKCPLYQRIGAHRRAEYAAIRARCRAAVDEAHAEFPVRGWQDWLLDRAAAGDRDALACLRRSRRPPRGGETLRLQGDGGGHGAASAAVPPGVVRANGDIVRRIGAGAVRDSGGEIRLTNASPDAVAAALEMAAGRWEGPLRISGGQAFSDAVAAVAGGQRMDMRFADAALDRRRKLIAALAGAERADYERIEGWVQARNAARERTADAGSAIRQHRPGERLAGRYGGIRRVSEGVAVALVELERGVVAVRVSGRQAQRFRRQSIGESMRVDSLGRCDFGRGLSR